MRLNHSLQGINRFEKADIDKDSQVLSQPWSVQSITTKDNHLEENRNEKTILYADKDAVLFSPLQTYEAVNPKLGNSVKRNNEGTNDYCFKNPTKNKSTLEKISQATKEVAS